MIIAIDPGELEVRSDPDSGLRLVMTAEIPAGLAGPAPGTEPGKPAVLEHQRFFRGWDDLMQVINALWRGGQDAFGPASGPDRVPKSKSSAEDSAR